MGKCSKDKRDIFYRLAKEEGWRARSVFKLLQIDSQFGIFNGVTRAVDLCSAPGSWSQVLSRELFKNTVDRDDIKIVSVDIQTVAPIEGVTIIQGDITSKETAERVIKEFEGSKARLIVCDGAPDVTGQHDLDEFMQSQLLLAALNITTFIIEDGGTFVAKIFRGRDISLLLSQLRIFFTEVQVVKPSSSRTSSIEGFVVCRYFKLPPNYVHHMFNLYTYSQLIDTSDNATNRLIPFICCGDLNGADPGQSNNANLNEDNRHFEPVLRSF